MRLAVNQDVAGSIPAWPANLYRGRILGSAPDCRSDLGGFDSRSRCQFLESVQQPKSIQLVIEKAKTNLLFMGAAQGGGGALQVP